MRFSKFLLKNPNIMMNVYYSTLQLTTKSLWKIKVISRLDYRQEMFFFFYDFFYKHFPILIIDFPIFPQKMILSPHRPFNYIQQCKPLHEVQIESSSTWALLFFFVFFQKTQNFHFFFKKKKK